MFIDRSMGDFPLEKLLEDKNLIEISDDDAIRIKFLTIAVAEIFYQKYSLYIGFRVRRDHKKKKWK